MTLIAHRGRCPRCGSDPQGDAEFRAALAAQRPAVQPTFSNVVTVWMQARESCQHYHGFKEDDDSVQCSHPDQRDPAAWCSVTRCPRLREAGEQHGVA